MPRLLRAVSYKTKRMVTSWSFRRKLRKYGLQHAYSIRTYTHQAELEALYKLARSLPKNSKIVEIGSHFGASTCFLAAGMMDKHGHLYCVDTWSNEAMPEGIQDTYDTFSANTAPIRDSITPIRKRSSDLNEDDLPDTVDLVFIDGDHSYDVVHHDFLLADRILSEQGVLVFHDAVAHKGVSLVIGQALGGAGWRLGGFVHNLCWLMRPPFSWQDQL